MKIKPFSNAHWDKWQGHVILISEQFSNNSNVLNKAAGVLFKEQLSALHTSPASRPSWMHISGFFCDRQELPGERQIWLEHMQNKPSPVLVPRQLLPATGPASAIRN